MSRFLSLSYYLSIRPDPNFQFTKLTVAIAAALILGGIALHYYRKAKVKDAITKKMIKKYPGKLQMFGVILLALLYFRETGLPYLSMRLWMFIWAICLIYVIIKEAKNFKKEYARRKAQAERNNRRKKYIPKKKRK